MGARGKDITPFGSGRPIFKSKAAARSAELAQSYQEDLALQRQLRDDFFRRNPKKEVP